QSPLHSPQILVEPRDADGAGPPAAHNLSMKTTSVVLAMILLAIVPRQATAQRTDAVPSLRVGAARVDITPSQGELPKNSRGGLDRLYARAIVLENGVSTAALITIDAGAVPDA